MGCQRGSSTLRSFRLGPPAGAARPGPSDQPPGFAPLGPGGPASGLGWSPPRGPGPGGRTTRRRSATEPSRPPGDRPARPHGPGGSEASCLRDGTASLRPGHAGPDSDRTWVRRSSRSWSPIDPPAPARAATRCPTVGRYRVGGRTDSAPLRLPDEPDGAAQPPARPAATKSESPGHQPDPRSGAAAVTDARALPIRRPSPPDVHRSRPGFALDSSHRRSRTVKRQVRMQSCSHGPQIPSLLARLSLTECLRFAKTDSYRLTVVPKNRHKSRRCQQKLFPNFF
jgi:hypothetical protein